CDAGDDGAVVRPDPALNRQLISQIRPARPLVLERDANLRHRPPFRQENVLDPPVKTARAPQTRHVPAPPANPRGPAPHDTLHSDRTGLRAPALPAVVHKLKAPQLVPSQFPPSQGSGTASAPRASLVAQSGCRAQHQDRLSGRWEAVIRISAIGCS